MNYETTNHKPLMPEQLRNLVSMYIRSLLSSNIITTWTFCFFRVPDLVPKEYHPQMKKCHSKGWRLKTKLAVSILLYGEICLWQTYSLDLMSDW